MKKLDMMRAIKERGFMAKDIADKLGITTVAMSLRTNAKNPRLDTMIQIAEIIGCDITDLFYPDPAEEAAEQEKRDGGMEQNIKEDLAHAKDGDIPLSQKLQDLVKRTYPGIKKEDVNELVEKLIQGRYGDKVFERLLQDANEAAERLYWDIGSHVGNGDNRTDNGIYRTDNDGKRTDNGMMRAETFCPHCGKKVRVGVVLLPEE